MPRAGNRDLEKKKYWLAVMPRWQKSGVSQVVIDLMTIGLFEVLRLID
jgi:hypothetical protein